MPTLNEAILRLSCSCLIYFGIFILLESRTISMLIEKVKPKKVQTTNINQKDDQVEQERRDVDREVKEIQSQSKILYAFSMKDIFSSYEFLIISVKNIYTQQNPDEKTASGECHQLYLGLASSGRARSADDEIASDHRGSGRDNDRRGHI